jgi:hypothetical protein
MQIPYTTVEQVAQSLSMLSTAYASKKIYSAILYASRISEGFLHRRFYPERRTIFMDWPNNSFAPSWSIPLGDQEIISLNEVVSGGTDISASCVLRRGDNLAEPPYSSLDINLATNASFSSGTTWQRAIEIDATFGYNDTATTTPSAVLSGGINSSVAAITLAPSSGLLDVGIGSLLKIESERVLVVGKNMVSLSATTSSALQSNQAAVSFTSASASSLVTGETILIDSERMLVNDIAGSTVIVTRAWDGTALAAHSSGATIYGLRTALVQRGVLGSTAASHSDAVSIYTHAYPAALSELVEAEAIVHLQQTAAAYARTIGSGAGTREAAGLGLDDIRERAWRELGRKARSAAV